MVTQTKKVEPLYMTQGLTLGAKGLIFFSAFCGCIYSPEASHFTVACSSRPQKAAFFSANRIELIFFYLNLWWPYLSIDHGRVNGAWL